MAEKSASERGASEVAYSPACPKGGRKICVGDCALFQPPQGSSPFIGVIRKVRKEESIWLVVNWIYRPSDVKLGRDILLEAAPNEVFYSFHKDEIPAASLLHPCKVAFLGKGATLPSGVSSYVCKRVYDIEHKCLLGLTDKKYNKEQQEEVRKLLNKTRLEMDGKVQLDSGGRSPRLLNVTTSQPQLKSGSDSTKSSSSSFSSLPNKGKKRELSGHVIDPVKHDNGSEDKLTSQIAKITQKGGLVDFEGVRKLVQLMHPEVAEMKIDLVGRIMFVDVISATESFDCLGRFVQLRGLPLLDEWLQEVRRGKIGGGTSPKESDKSVDEFVLAILRALEKVPVNLHSLQTCNVGKSVNYLRSHKNSDIQKKARTLVDIWKKRVEAEMNVIDAKSGLSRSVSWPSKPVSSEVSHVGSSKTGGTNEVDIKSSIQQQAPPESPSQNLINAEVGSKVQAAYPVSNGVGKSSRLIRNVTFEEGSPNGAKLDKVTDVPPVDHANNQRLIVRLPNTDRSPVPSASEGSVEEPTVALKASPSSANSERSRLHDKKARAKSISERAVLNAESSKSKDGGVDEFHKGKVSPADAQLDEQRRENEYCEILKEASKAILSSETALESGKSFEASFNSINALVDSCVKISEATASASVSDDVGIKLLASVAAGEISKPGMSSQFGPGKSSSAPEDTCSDSNAKLRPPDGATANTQGESIGGNIHPKPSISVSTSFVGGRIAALSAIEEAKKECGTQVKTPSRQHSAEKSCLAPLRNHSGEISIIAQRVGINEVSTISSDKDDKLNHADESLMKNNVSTEVEVGSENVKVEDIKADAPHLSATVEVKNQLNNEQPFVKPIGLKSLDGDSKIDVLRTSSPDDKGTTVTGQNGDCAGANFDKNLNACIDVESVLREKFPQKIEQLKPDECKLDVAVAKGTDERHASSVKAPPPPLIESETSSRLDFDLNEGFPVDDEIQGEQSKSPVPFNSSPIRLSCPLPYHLSSVSGSTPASVTVAAAAKGPFVHPENLPRTKGELGWKGSAATSAFRPAEPRKVLELPATNINTNSATSKRARPPLDIDLNVADERSCEDVTSPYPAKKLCTEIRSCDQSVGPAGGFDFDLNRVGECPDTQPFSVNSRYKSENLLFLRRPLPSGGFSNGEMSTSRNFDLNDGPCIDESGTESNPLRPNTRSDAPFLSQVPGDAMSHAELGNMSSWFPPVNSYSPVTIPSFLPSRGDQSYAVPNAGGPQRVFVPSVNGEMFRGAVLSSSPALVFPPSTPFPYSGYPFEASFPVASNSFSGSSGGAICYSAIPSQLEGSTNAIPSQYPRSYVMGLPGSTAAAGHENRKWGNQGLDLNSGPRSTDVSPALRPIKVGPPPPAQANEQLHMFQIAGGMFKRKEPDSGWEMSTDRYKHS